jgi:hypothetical protein
MLSPNPTFTFPESVHGKRVMTDLYNSTIYDELPLSSQSNRTLGRDGRDTVIDVVLGHVDDHE